MNAATPCTTLASSLDQFLCELDKSPLTIQAYRTDNQQFLAWLTDNDAVITTRTAGQTQPCQPIPQISGEQRTNWNDPFKKADLYAALLFPSGERGYYPALSNYNG